MILYGKENVQGTGLGACLPSCIVLGLLVPGLVQGGHLNGVSSVVVLPEPNILKEWGGWGVVQT